MEVNGGPGRGSSRAHDLPVHYLRLLATPVQLLSAAMWHTVQGGLVDRFGVLEEFVSMTTELVPELMSYSQRSQLILGLRARLVLEMCRGDHPVDFEVIQPHLDRIKAPVSGTKDHQVTVGQVEESEVNFVELVHSLLDDPAERKFFFEEVFPMYFGPKFDAALEMLMWEFISRLEELLPLPDFTQLAALLGDTPAFLDDCLTSFFSPEDMKTVLKHHRQMGHFQEKDPRLLPMDDCILTSMSLSPAARRAGTSAPPISAYRDSDPPDYILVSETSRLRPAGRAAAMKADETIDLTLGSAAPESEDEGCSTRARVQRKRKLSRGEDPPPKLTKSLLDEQYSAVSPLISIWGDYTAEGPGLHGLRAPTDDAQEDSGLTQMDSKVPWSDEETMILLDIWGQDSTQRALKRCLKNRHIFAQIAQKMAERGYARSTEQCQTRIKRLKKCFRRNVRGNSGNEYKFYEQLQRVLGASRAPDPLEVSYDVDEIVEEEESRDADEELQFVEQAPPVETVSGVRVPWTDMETLTLINTWGDDRMKKRSGAQRTGNIFAFISSKMAAQGFSRTPEQCQTRLKRLRSKFRQCYENNIRGRRQVHCRFYNQLGRVLVKDFEPDPSLSDDPEPEDSQPEPGGCGSGQDERRKVPWSDRETVILLELWGDAQMNQASGRTSNNVLLFTEIADKLTGSGFSRTPEQCQTRVKRLKSMYWQCRDSARTDGDGKMDFRFYELMEQILDKQPSTSAAASAVTDSIEISEESADEEDSNAAESAVSAEKTPQNSWTDEETLGLISVWGDPKVQEAFAAPVSNRLVHANIAERMKQLGYSRSGEQCRWKMKALRNNFRNSYERKLNGKVVDYRFYDLLEKILAPRVDTEEADDALEQVSVCADPANLPWTEVETMTLVQVWAADDVQLSLKMSVRNGHVYADIADKMAALGYRRTAEQCQNRMKRLKKTYRRHCNSRRNGARAAFQYFHLMDPVLNGSVPTSEAVPVAWSLPPEKDHDVSASQPAPDSGKKTPWSEQETRTLLRVWGDDGVQLTLKGCQKNRHVFNFISDRMSESGYSRTPDQCYTRIKRLKHGFLHEKEEFKFFVEMEEIFSRDLTVDESAAEEPEEGAAEPETEEAPAEVQWTPDTTKHPWGDPETRVLLEIWGSEDMQESLRSCTKNKHVFVLISEAMVGRGYPRTPEQCQTRIKRLRANFRHSLDGRKGENECKFFQQLSTIFGDKYGAVDTPPDDFDDQDEAADGVS